MSTQPEKAAQCRQMFSSWAGDTGVSPRALRPPNKGFLPFCLVFIKMYVIIVQSRLKTENILLNWATPYTTHHLGPIYLLFKITFLLKHSYDCRIE